MLVAAMVAALAQRVEAQVRLNEALALNRFTILDEDDDSADWIELHNAGAEPVDLGGAGLSDDPRIPFKWVFPQAVLAPGGYLLVWASGKNRLAVDPAKVLARDSRVPFDADFAALDSEWRYLADVPEAAGPPAGWNDRDFDDAGWRVGTPGFGFGYEGLSTELPPGVGTLFLRRAFRVDVAEHLPSLYFQARYDDGFVLYLNGVRALSVNFPEDEEPVFGSASTRREPATLVTRFDLTPWLENGTVRSGDNVVALAVLNRTPGSDSRVNDMAMFPELGVVPPVLHTNFRVGRQDRSLSLVGADGVLLDSLRIPAQTEDRSWGRDPADPERLAYFLTPTPRASNGMLHSAAPLPSIPTASPAPGRHPGPVAVELDIALPFEPIVLRRTVDGTEPGPRSRLVDGPIRVERDTVVRAAAFLGDRRVSQVFTGSYFVEGEQYNVPIMSVAMAPADFEVVHLTQEGRGFEFERPAHMEIFDPDGSRALATGFGLRLHGNVARAGELSTKKSYRVYFRDLYGLGRLRFPIIPDAGVDQFDVLVLRSNMHDAFRTTSNATLMRDQLIRDLHKDLGGVVSSGAWHHLLVNTRYRGIYNTVERIDSDFFVIHFPGDADGWDVLNQGVRIDGDPREWRALIDSTIDVDFTDDAAFAALAERIDLASFTRYTIVSIWSQNHDWPANNWYVARPRREGGKWIFLDWDTEFGFGQSPSGFRSNTLEHVFTVTGTDLPGLIRSVLQNLGYQKRFVAEFLGHLDGVLAPENVLARIRELRDLLAPDIAHELALFGQRPATWERNVRVLETFAQNRGPVVRRQLLESPRFSFARVTAVSPPEVSPRREIELTLSGLGFNAGARVRFNGVESERTSLVSPTELVAALPYDIRVDGSPDVTIVDPVSGEFTTTGLVAVAFPRPQPLEISPATGSPLGGDIVTITGEDFLPGVRVEFGESSADVIEQSDRILRVRTPPGRDRVEVRVVNTRPGELPAATTLEFVYASGPRFLRGDATGDGRLAVTDAVAVLEFLFKRGESRCVKSLDADDDGRVRVTDAVWILRKLFAGGRELPPPARACGEDETPDRLACEAHGACE